MVSKIWFRAHRGKLLAILAAVSLVAVSSLTWRSGNEDGSSTDSAAPTSSPIAKGTDPAARPGGSPGVGTSPDAVGQPTQEVTLPPPPAAPGRALSARELTSGSRVLKPGSSIQTESIRARSGGLVLVWVVGMTAGDTPAPIPTVSGAGLQFRLLESATKKEGAPRRISLFSASVGGSPRSGALTIDFGREYDSSQWFWAAVQTDGRTPTQTALNGDENWVDTYSVTFARPTTSNNATLVGFLIGRSETPVAEPPMRSLVHVPGTGIGTLFIQWTNHSVRGGTCTWDEPAHSIAVGVEIAT